MTAGVIMLMPPAGRRSSKAVLCVVVLDFLVVEELPVCLPVEIVLDFESVFVGLAVLLPVEVGEVVCFAGDAVVSDEVVFVSCRTIKLSNSGSHLGHTGQAAVNVARSSRSIVESCRFPDALMVFVVSFSSQKSQYPRSNS